MRGEETALMQATAAEQIASGWLERQHFSVWSNEDRAAFEAWLSQSPSHEVAYLRLEAAWSRTERLAALRTSVPEHADIPTMQRQAMLGGLVAAFIAVILVGLGAGILLSGPGEKTYATALGARQIIHLADGSQIDLNTDTVLHTTFGAHQRIVVLEKGEAYFQVKHDASRPFTVIAGSHRMTDLGTKFLVHRADANLEVAVVEGLVRFEAADGLDKSPGMLRPGDTAVATANSILIVRKSTTQLANELSWRKGVLVFDHTTLAEAADQINRYNGKKLIIADADAGRLMIGGTFPVNNVKAIAEAAQDSFGLRIENRGDEIVISR
ncbi:MAG TPA: FecR domain-containing protein [Rhizomicrobium sp.]